MDTNSQPQMPPPTLRIDSPSSLIVATGPLIGRTPANELVIWVGNDARPGLITAALDALVHAQAMDDLVDQLLGACPEHVMIVAWESVADDCDLIGLHGCRVVGELVWRLTEAGVEVVAALTTNGRVWWSHICSADGIEGFGHQCQATATQVDGSIALAVRAELVAAGYCLSDSPLPCADPGFSAAVAEALADNRAPALPLLESWRDQEIAWLSALWRRHSKPDSAATCAPAVIARAVVALADVRVRDTVMFRMGLWGPRQRTVMTSLAPLLEQILAASPHQDRAPAATILALVQWLDGHPDPARGLLGLALRVDPDYNLARLASLLVESDLSPATWRSGLVELTEQECRTGRQDPRYRKQRARRVVHLRRIAG